MFGKLITAGWLISIVLLTPLVSRSQEVGEMLRFGDHYQLGSAQLQRQALAAHWQSVASSTTSQPFDSLLLNGQLEDRDVLIEIRGQTSEGVWGEWRPVAMKPFPNGRFWAKWHAAGTAVSSIQLRAFRPQQFSMQAPVLTIYAVEVFRQNDKEANSPREENSTPENSGENFSSVRQPVINDRSSWGAQPPRGAYVPHIPYRFAQHHTAGRRTSTFAETVAELQFIQDFHQNGRGWQDIGYHFLLDDAGRILQGVPEQFRGTHAGGNNTGNIGVCMLGNYQEPGVLPTTAQLDSVTALYAWLAFQYRVNIDSLFSHRDYNSTACPGDNVYIRLADIRTGVRRTLGMGAPYLANIFPQPFREDIDPAANISFQLTDDQEGVNPSSLALKVSGVAVNPTQLQGTPNLYNITYDPPVNFQNSEIVNVEIQAQDLASPPSLMAYLFRFKTAAVALLAEILNLNNMSRGAVQLQGSWATDAADAALPGLSNGVSAAAFDADSSHYALVLPEVAEAGDYQISLAFGRDYIGDNARYQLSKSDGRGQPLVIEHNAVYRNTWGRFGNGPVRIEAGATPGFQIELIGFKTILTRMVVDAFRFEKIPAGTPPPVPALRAVRPVSGGIEVSWYPDLAGDIIGYRLFASSDGRNWGPPLADEKILTPAISRYVHADNANSPIYFYLVTVDSISVEVEGGKIDYQTSQPSDIYGIKATAQPVLIVDNFDRRASWTKLQHPFVRSYGEALSALGVGFHSCVNDAVQTGEIPLQNYRAAIYFCGDDSDADEAIAFVDQQRVRQYLESGGRLFISGSELGYEMARSGRPEATRFAELFKAVYQGDDAANKQVAGVAGSAFQGLTFGYGTTASDDNYFEDFPDYINASGGGQIVLHYGNLRGAAVSYRGNYGAIGNPSARMVYMAFPFETINLAADRVAVMRAVLSELDIQTAVAEQASEIPQRFALAQNFPNPFNPTTTIEFELPIAAPTTLILYDLQGREVRRVLDERLAAGRHRVHLDGAELASGIYFYRLSATEKNGKQQVLTRKLTLMK